MEALRGKKKIFIFFSLFLSLFLYLNIYELKEILKLNFLTQENIFFIFLFSAISLLDMRLGKEKSSFASFVLIAVGFVVQNELHQFLLMFLSFSFFLSNQKERTVYVLTAFLILFFFIINSFEYFDGFEKISDIEDKIKEFQLEGIGYEALYFLIVAHYMLFLFYLDRGGKKVAPIFILFLILSNLLNFEEIDNRNCFFLMSFFSMIYFLNFNKSKEINVSQFFVTTVCFFRDFFSLSHEIIFFLLVLFFSFSKGYREYRYILLGLNVLLFKKIILISFESSLFRFEYVLILIMSLLFCSLKPEKIGLKNV